ncbi:MAG: hypothetical protein K6U11_08535 [bacterium]|nr:hypothetical protein [bacterium]
MKFVRGNQIACLFIFMLVGMVFLSVSVWALEPTVTDVTTRSFSVVWTESSPGLGACSLKVQKKGGAFVENSQIILESDADALNRGVIKYEVVGLDYGTTYIYSGTRRDGSAFTGEKPVTTALFRGLVSLDPEANDIVTNDIFHVAVYNADGKTPALGALVMAEIYEDASCTKKKSAYPLTGWVGFGMPGNPQAASYTAKTFDSDNISYKEYAALNLNNLFADDPATPAEDLFPLQLTGDDPTTTSVVEGNYIKVVVIPGVTPVAGDTVQIMPVPGITKVGNQEISSAKAATKIIFQAGMNTFSYPFEVPAGYTIKKLVEAIYLAGGKVKQIKRYDKGSWPVASVVYLSTGPKITPAANGEVPINPGEGYLVIMDGTALPQNFYISGSPTPTTITLRAGMNVVNFTQIPSFYKISDLVKAISVAGGKVKQIKRYDKGSWPVASVVYLSTGPKITPAANGEVLIERGKAYLVIMDSIPAGAGTLTVDPLVIK